MKYISRTSNLFFALLLLGAALSGSLISCSSEPVTPEVTVSEGNVDYFKESMDFPSSGGSKTLSFTTNVDWTIEPAATQSGGTWWTLSQSKGSSGTQNITVTLQENTGYDDRNVVLVLTAGDIKKNIIINQKQKNAITLTTDRFEVDAKGGSIDIEVKSNVDYNVEIPEQYKSWINQKSRSRALSSRTLSFDIAESTEYDKREGEIIFTSGDITEKVKVYQAGSTILILSQNEYTLGTEGGTVSVEISSNFEFETDMPDVDWIKSADKSRAVSSHTLVYEISPNNTYDDREAVIIYKDAKSDKKESVTIRQRQKDGIVLANKKLEFTQDGGHINVDINSNISFTHEIAGDGKAWLKANYVNSSRSLEKKTVDIYASKNQSLEKREGEIYFKNGNIADTLKVYQAGGAILVLSQDTYNLDGSETSISVELKSNIDYRVSINDSWISEISSRAVSSSTKRFNIASNRTGSRRTGTITFTTADGSKTATVKVVQDAAKIATSLKISFDDMLFGYIGNSMNCTVTPTPSNAVADYEWSTSNTDVVSISGSGNTITATNRGFGNAVITVKDKISGLTTEIEGHTRVSGFSWNDTGDLYNGYYPMMTIAVGESEKLPYTSYQGSSVPNLFGSYSDFVFYEPQYVVSQPSVVSISPDGTVTGLKTGTVGIKPTGYIQKSGNDRLYIKVVDSYKESEYNNDFSSANIIKDGQDIQFCLSSQSDVDVFKFNRKSSYMYINVEYLGGYNYSNYDKMLRYEVYDSNKSLTGSGTMSFKGTGSKYDPMMRSVGNGNIAYIRFYFPTSSTSKSFPDGYFKVSVKESDM